MDKYKERFGLEAGVAADPLDQIILGVKEGTMDLSDEEEVSTIFEVRFALSREG